MVVVSLVTALLSLWWGSAVDWSQGQKAGVFVLFPLLLALFWHRTKQRAYYYVREVLLNAEALADKKGRPAEPDSRPERGEDHG